MTDSQDIKVRLWASVVCVCIFVGICVFYTPAAAECVHTHILASTWRGRARANIKILQSALSMVHKLQQCAFRAVNVSVEGTDGYKDIHAHP